MNGRKMSLNTKYITLSLLWLAGAILLWSSGNSTPAIIVGLILLYSFYKEKNKNKEI